MLANIDTPPYVEDLHEQNKKTAQTIANALKDCGQSEKVKVQTDLLKRNQACYVYVVNGFIKLFVQDKLIRFYTDHDLFFVDPKSLEASSVILSEFASDVIFFDPAKLSQALAHNQEILELWMKHQNNEHKIITHLLTLYMRDEIMPKIAMKNFKVDETIIKQGTEPTEMYELVQGEACVLIDGKEVSQVKAGEIFGEISFLTEQTRTADVIAKTPCMVQVIQKDDFANLIQSKPRLIMTVMQNLSHRILNLNKKIK